MSASATGTPQAKSTTPSAGQNVGTSQAQATGSQAAAKIASPATSP
jgi:hypothetical protein